MASAIRASCPVCGEVELTSDDMRLMVCETNDALSYYEFGCPRCQDDVRKPADDHVISLLLSGGVVAFVWSIDPRPEGPQLTEDDEIAFGRDVERTPFLAAFAAAETGGDRPG